MNKSVAMEEHSFYGNKYIKITSTIIEYEDTIISTKSISSVEIDKEEVEPPVGLIGLGVIGLIYGSSLPHEIISTAGLILIILGLATIGVRKITRINKLIITLDSGKSFVIENEHIDEEELETILIHLRDAIIFRG